MSYSPLLKEDTEDFSPLFRTPAPSRGKKWGRVKHKKKGKKVARADQMTAERRLVRNSLNPSASRMIWCVPAGC